MLKEKLEDRPRERLVTLGTNALSNIELLAILLQTGTKKLSVIELSKSLIESMDSIAEMENMSYAEWILKEGIGHAKASIILASLELSKRILSARELKKTQIQKPMDVYHYLKEHLIHLEQEHFYALYLNTKSYILDSKLLFIGTLNHSEIHPREIFKHAVKLSAAAIILVHNHPSGDSLPSRSDIQATHLIEQSSELLGIKIIDHIVIGHGECFSINENHKYYLSDNRL